MDLGLKKILVTPFLFLLLIGCKTYWVEDKVESKNVVITNELEGNTDNKIEQLVKPYRDSMSVTMNEVLNVSEVEMTTGIPEGNLGNFVADLVYDIGRENYKQNIDFVLLNNGGLRTSLPKGEITRKKIYELMPFENELVVLTLSMEKTKELFEFVAQKTDTNLSVKKGVPLSKQVKLVVQNQKPKEVMIGEVGLVQKEYKVLTSDYLAGGGDNMNFFLDPIKTEKLGLKLRDAIIEKIVKERQKGNTLNAKKDNRIRYAGR